MSIRAPRNRPRHLILIFQTLALLICLWMLATRGHASERSDEQVDVAVLKNRADAQERHMEATDSNVTRLELSVNDLEKDMSGVHVEERIAWTILTALIGGSLVIQSRRPKPVKDGDQAP